MKKYYFLLLIFFLICILSLGNLQNLCNVYLTTGSDNQTLLLWQYTAKIGMLPYRDIFYPYGYLNYYLTLNSYFAIAYFLLIPLLFTIMFLALRRIFVNRVYLILSLLFFYFYILHITGFETFSRYGALVAFSILFAFYFATNKYIKKFLIGMGIAVGFIFPFIIDVGFYTPVLFILFSLTNSYLGSRKRRWVYHVQDCFKEICFFIVGFCIGIIPFILYLLQTRSLIPFFGYIKNLHDISLYAKTPFFHSLTSIDNQFVFIILLIAISYIAYRFILKREKPTLISYFQIGFVFTILLLEQKNIIRSIDTQLTFIGALLLLTLFADVKLWLVKRKIHYFLAFLYFINMLIFVLFVLGLHSPTNFINQYPSFTRETASINTFATNQCVSDNMNYILGRNKQYIAIKQKIIASPSFNGKIFIFPGDPIFYILFNQWPPFYPSIYEATPFYAQQTLIKYIQDHHINIILYNTNIKSIQDGVPDTVRGKILYRYIRDNYSVAANEKGYLILIKKNHKKK